MNFITPEFLSAILPLSSNLLIYVYGFLYIYFEKDFIEIQAS